jgi:hypothetical protein
LRLSIRPPERRTFTSADRAEVTAGVADSGDKGIRLLTRAVPHNNRNRNRPKRCGNRVPKLDTPMCRDCERLWQAYQRATAEHLSLLNRLRLASALTDRTLAEALIQEVSAAEFRKKKAKKSLDAHHSETGHC